MGGAKVGNVPSRVAFIWILDQFLFVIRKLFLHCRRNVYLCTWRDPRRETPHIGFVGKMHLCDFVKGINGDDALRCFLILCYKIASKYGIVEKATSKANDNKKTLLH